MVVLTDQHFGVMLMMPSNVMKVEELFKVKLVSELVRLCCFLPLKMRNIILLHLVQTVLWWPLELHTSSKYFYLVRGRLWLKVFHVLVAAVQFH